MLEIFRYFLRLGCLGFGGPIALVAQMQKDLVEERKWQNHEEFVQSLALIKSMPGPFAFSTASYLGTIRAGFWGGQIAGWSLVFPAFLLMVVLAINYDTYSRQPLILAALLGMQAAALGFIIYSIKGLAQGYFRRPLFIALMLFSLLLTWQQFPEPLVILAMGGVSLFVLRRQRSGLHILSVGLFPLLFDERVRHLFWICFTSGALVFGTGLAIVPVLEQGFVQDMNWLTHGQFMDALAFGQMTPGPVLVTVTFVGYKVAGLFGAIVATIGIFLASSFHMTTWFPRMTSWLSKQKWVGDFVLGALAAVIGSLIVVSYRLLSMSSERQIILTLVIVVVLAKWKIPSWSIILAGGVIGLLLLRPA